MHVPRSLGTALPLVAMLAGERRVLASNRRKHWQMQIAALPVRAIGIVAALCGSGKGWRHRRPHRRPPFPAIPNTKHLTRLALGRALPLRATASRSNQSTGSQS
jgi:hypothetical protein